MLEILNDINKSVAHDVGASGYSNIYRGDTSMSIYPHDPISEALGLRNIYEVCPDFDPNDTSQCEELGPYGYSFSGWNHTEETKQLLSEKQKGIPKPNLRGAGNGMFGKHHTKEHKQYLSEINSGKNNAFYGKTHTKEVRERLSKAAKSRVGPLSNAYGYQHTKENKDKFSAMYKGKPRAVPHEVVKCPHCEKEGIKPNMKRWHFDKCKQKNS